MTHSPKAALLLDTAQITTLRHGIFLQALQNRRDDDPSLMSGMIAAFEALLHSRRHHLPFACLYIFFGWDILGFVINSKGAEIMAAFSESYEHGTLCAAI